MMPRKIWPLLPLTFPVFLLLGCSASRIGSDEWLAPFRYAAPAPQEIRTQGVSRSFPGTFDDMWESALLILTKSATIAAAQKDSGVIVYFTNLTNPSVVFVENANNGDIQVWFDRGKYAGSGDKEPPAASNDRTREAETFFTQLTTQLLAEKRWQLSTTGTAKPKRLSSF
jgi:hypothetical protein